MVKEKQDERCDCGEEEEVITKNTFRNEQNYRSTGANS